jgi:ATPase subunit of ABC transporter with duplicated ATPase domains
LELRAHLGAFGLSGNLALQPIGSLSGGQKTRLSFATVCLYKPHLLLLDEPTNHLSIEGIEALIKACNDFHGGVIVVSHNKYFLHEVCNEIISVGSHSNSSNSAGKGMGKKSSSTSNTSTSTTTSSNSNGASRISIHKAAISSDTESTTSGKTIEEILEEVIAQQMNR